MIFSENYSFLIQNAIQSHHCNNNHPFVIPGSERDENGQPHFDCFVLISKCTNYDTVAVHLFQTKLSIWLVVKICKENVKTIYYFSDGAASQYKNKKNLINLTYDFKDFNIEAEWHFFST